MGKSSQSALICGAVPAHHPHFSAETGHYPEWRYLVWTDTPAAQIAARECSNAPWAHSNLLGNFPGVAVRI